MKVDIQLNFEPIIAKTKSNALGLYTAQQTEKTFSRYVPRRDGELMNNITYEPWQYTHNAPYARYIYNGIMYVDPKYGKGGFTKDGIKFWSRPGVKKKPSGKPLSIRKDLNPKATSHWVERAIQEKQDQKVVQAVQTWIEKNI